MSEEIVNVFQKRQDLNKSIKIEKEKLGIRHARMKQQEHAALKKVLREHYAAHNEQADSSGSVSGFIKAVYAMTLAKFVNPPLYRAAWLTYDVYKEEAVALRVSE